MSATVYADVSMGFHAAPSHDYFQLTEANQGSFKSGFIDEIEDSDEGIPANVRNNWRNLEYTADNTGHLSASFIASEIDSIFKAYSAPNAEFSIDTSAPLQVLYQWVNGKRTCVRVYQVRRAIGQGSFVDWEFTETYGQTTVTVPVTAEFSWPVIY